MPSVVTSRPGNGFWYELPPKPTKPGIDYRFDSAIALS